MATTAVYITHGNEQTQTIKDKVKFDSGADRKGARALSDLLASIAGGARNGKITLGVGGSVFAQATGTVLLAQASITAADIVYVGSVGFVATNGAVTPGQATFDMRTSDTAAAASLAAQINAHASLSGIVTATSSTGTVTITSVQVGELNNHITLAKVDANNAAFILNGSANTVHQTTLTGGTGGIDTAPVTYSLGV